MTWLEVQRNPFPNHKGKRVATIVICTNLGDEEEERPSFATEAIMTLQRSSQFKNLFDQLELTTNEKRMAMKALVSIVLGVVVECPTIETRPNQAFLEDTNEIIFSDEGMEVNTQIIEDLFILWPQ